MSNKVLIIHHDSSEFMLDSIVTNLEKAGLTACLTEPIPEKIAAERDDTDLFLIYAGDYIGNIRSVMAELREYCLKEEMPICVIGYDKDVALVEDVIPSYLIAYKFIRPFEMKTLIEIIQHLSDAPGTKFYKRSILLVDDDPVFLKTMLKFLSDTYNVTAVRSGQSSIKYLDAHTVDLILLDYDMPMLSGPQTLEKMRRREHIAKIPVIFLTGVSDRESVVNVMQMRPDGYLLKNMGKEELLEAITGFFLTKKWKDNL